MDQGEVKAVLNQVAYCIIDCCGWILCLCMVNGLFVGVWGSSGIRAGVEGMKKCSICGKPALEVVEVCPECLQRAAVDPGQIKRLKQISNVLSITAGTDTNIKECMESILEIAEDLERSGNIGEKERTEKGAAVPEKQ